MRLGVHLVLTCLFAAIFCDLVWSQHADTQNESTPFHKASWPAPAPGTIFLYPERISHNDEFIHVERGMVFVPMTRSNPKSDVIGIEIYRFKAESGPPDSPPVFLLMGGPGFPGLRDSLQSVAFFTQEVWPITRGVGADLIVVGQRGIGSSKPDTLIEAIGSFPPNEEVTDEQFARAVQTACEKGKQFWKANGLDLSGFTAIEAAADVKDIRDAFGYDKIIISGESFGSHCGMAVMRYHPEIVERALLSSLEGPDHTWDMPSHVMNSIERIASAAEKDQGLGKWLPKRGLVDALKDVIERVTSKPIVVEVRHPQTRKLQSVRLDARVVKSLAMGYTSSLRTRRGMPSWPIDILDLYRGNYDRAAETLVRRGAGSNLTASFFLLDCASGISRLRKEQLDADPAADVLGDLNRLYRASCSVWDIDLGDDFRQNFDTNIPTLLVHGTWDVSTPLENAHELAPHFKNSKLVLVNGGSHDALDEAVNASQAFRAGLAKFLRTGDFSGLPNEVNLPPIKWQTPK